MNETYCPRLWNEFFINSNGNIYSCCHHKPKKLGNVKVNKLEEMYNHEVILKLRKQSLTGKLDCFKKCNLLNEDEINNYRFSNVEILKEDLRRLKIVFGEGCNINCRMCWQNSKSKKMLNADLLKQNINLNDFKLLDIQGGEPLFIKSSRDYFTYASEQNVEISIQTNGTIMTKEIAEQLMKSSRSIKISLNAGTKEFHEYVNRGSNWDKVLANISFVRSAKHKLNPKFKIIGHMTIIIENLDDICNFIERAKQFGFDEIEFGYDFRVPIYLKLHQKKKNILKLQIKQTLEKRESEIIINLDRIRKLELI